jgi:hypothetical protein
MRRVAPQRNEFKMFAHSKAFLLATATAICLPALASAATIVNLSAGQPYVFAETINPRETLEFRFTALENLSVQRFTLSASGSSAGSDVGSIRFGFSQPATGAINPITVTDDVASGVGVLPGDTYAAGETFSIFVEDGIRNPVGVTLAFNTAAVSAIPLPATALLLLPFLVAGGVLGRRRNAAKRLATA